MLAARSRWPATATPSTAHSRRPPPPPAADRPPPPPRCPARWTYPVQAMAPSPYDLPGRSASGRRQRGRCAPPDPAHPPHRRSRARNLQVDVPTVRRQQRLRPLRPLHQHHLRTLAQLVPPQLEDLTRILEPVQVQVHHV